jgi:hypothetical protein
MPQTARAFWGFLLSGKQDAKKTNQARYYFYS